MKICNNARNCCYGNHTYLNLCAYNDNMNQEDECPMRADDSDFYNADLEVLYVKSSFNNTNEDIIEEEDNVAADMWYPPEEDCWF